MSAGTNAPGTRLALPSGYVAEVTEGGRLAIYATETGAWIGEVDPIFANAREVTQELIIAHENEEIRRQLPTVRDLEEVIPDDFMEQEDKNVSELHEGELSQLAVNNPRAAILRIRELEIVAALAADSLRTAGDEATAEVVEAILEGRSDGSRYASRGNG